MSKSKQSKREQTGLGDALFGTRLGEVRQSEPPRQASELFIVDNSDANWKVKTYLQQWSEISSSFDIATGYFEIGALLALDGQWQKLDSLRILMGAEVSMRTKKALLAGIETAKKVLDNSLEAEKENDDFLTGVPAIVDAIQKKKIECKIYTKDKFHAKAYITHAKQAVVGSAALVGSSNFTLPGLTTNVELNVQLRREVDILQKWFEDHWKNAEDVSAELLKVIERQIHEYLPFEVYAKSLQEFFRGHEMTAGEWEKTTSKVYPVLDQYQKEGYQAILKIASKHNGAFLCDGVGLGKTLIGLMIIERLIYDRNRVLLLVPKAAREPVWEKHLQRYLPGLGGDYSNLAVYNHTDLLREGKFPAKFEKIKEMTDVIIIDEGHHFRNPGVHGKTHYWKLDDICQGKKVIFLTATPINNSLRDLQHMIELFSRRDNGYFKSAPLGIYSLTGHFRKLEKDLEKIMAEKPSEDDGAVDTDQVEAQQVLLNDNLFRALVVQRSRAYVRKSQEQYGGNKVIFPAREKPQIAKYNLKIVYGRLLDMVEKAFSKEKPLFSLAMYYPLAYSKKPADSTDVQEAFDINRQKQLVRLIRILFLKRFESSACAFEMSCQELLLKMLAFAIKNSKTEEDKKHLEKWKARNGDLIGYVQEKQLELLPEKPDEDAEDIITSEMLEDTEELEPDKYHMDKILADTRDDLEQIADFLKELKQFQPANDDKLKALVKLLKTDPVLSQHKVIVFSEFMTTARYLRKELEKAGIMGLDEVDSATKGDRGDVITRFSPYYNEQTSAQLKAKGVNETRVLISTDVLSEGLNLQDATRLINYDLHWNPVRLMQRIGRVDRRLNPEIEAQIISDHPEQKDIRRKVMYWNFLPPDDLEGLIHLYSKVSGKALRISKVFGIQGRKLLKPDDNYDDLKDFNHDYEGTTSTLEEMHLEYQKLLHEYPDLEERLNNLPGRVFSGKQHPKPGTQAVFFCYALPVLSSKKNEAGEEVQEWITDAGYSQWYLYNLENGNIITEPADIIDLIRSKPETPRFRSIPNETLSQIRLKIEKEIKDSYLKKVQAPIGVKSILKAWMELS
ncbi:MAG: helicase-related protein [Dehalococcoidales bacterium]|nr:helicase-related protein [Dehalococcoidales bacterium]